MSIQSNAVTVPLNRPRHTASKPLSTLFPLLSTLWNIQTSLNKLGATLTDDDDVLEQVQQGINTLVVGPVNSIISDRITGTERIKFVE
jgi:hypothetical protein